MTDNVSGDLDTAAGSYGLADNEYLAECPGCDGTGEAYSSRFSPFASTCRECLGSGEIEVDR